MVQNANNTSLETVSKFTAVTTSLKEITFSNKERKYGQTPPILK